MDTRQKAHEEIKKKKEIYQAQVLYLLKKRQYTADEMANIIGTIELNIRPRCSELKGKILKTGKYRLSNNGHPQIVWKLKR